jgi:transcriptional regulator with XRE-family HTH domain
MANKDIRIKEMLGTGLSSETVASAIGVDPSYISQLLSDENFFSEVAELRSKHLIAHTTRDLSIDSLEDKLISTLHEMVDDARFMKPADALHAFRVINGAHRRGERVRPTEGKAGTVVNIQIPVAVKTHIQLNSKNEVLEVNGQTLVTMPSGQLIDQIAQQKGEQGEGAFTKLGKAIQRIASGGR